MSARWRIVPGVPSDEMKEARHPNSPCIVGKGGAQVYTAMLAAAPPASEDAELREGLERVLAVFFQPRQLRDDKHIAAARAVLNLLEGAQ